MDYETFKKIRVKYIPSLFSHADESNSYKNISINCIFDEIMLSGDFLQFGVFRGHTARILESYILLGRKLHLFDSFEGLLEDWSDTKFKKGHFSGTADEIFAFDPSRTVVHKGWFSGTIGPYKETYSNPVSMIHLDADLYSSTIDVLEGLNDQIVLGTILLFDEIFLPGSGQVSDDEARALTDWAQKFDREYQILWRTRWVQCAVSVLR